MSAGDGAVLPAGPRRAGAARQLRDLGVEVRFGSAVGTGGAAVNIIAGGGDRRCPEVLRSRPSDPTEVLLPAGSGRWMYARQGRPDEGWTPPRLVAAIRTAVGVPDLPLTVDAVFPFTTSGALATRSAPAPRSSSATRRTA